MLNNIGRVNRCLGRYDTALEYCYRFVAINPNGPSIGVNIATAFSSKKEYDRAKPLFETEIKRLESINTEETRNTLKIAYVNYALCIGEMNALNGARVYLDKAGKAGYLNCDEVWNRLQTMD